MNQQQSIDLFLKGKTSWNKWAIRLLKRREKLINQGRWQETTSYDFEKGYIASKGHNKETREWLQRALVDFASLTFTVNNNSKASSQNLALQSFTNRMRNVIEEDAKTLRLRSESIDFREFIFPGDTLFNNTVFEGNALFNDTEFRGCAWFNEAEFTLAAWFKNVKFTGASSFDYAAFKSFASFGRTVFKRGAYFQSIKVIRGFTLQDTTFETELPNFIGAKFKEAPQLKNISLLPAPQPKRFSTRVKHNLKTVSNERRYLRRIMLAELMALDAVKERLQHSKEKFLNLRRNRDDELRYRALKELAFAANDQKHQRRFFADEVRAKRHLSDKLNDLSGGLPRYICGVLYELTSDFGRSLWRPATCWIAVFYLFAGLNLVGSPNTGVKNCKSDPTITPFEAAKTISLQNAFPISFASQEKALKSAYTCLYQAQINFAALHARLKKERIKDQSRLKPIKHREIAEHLETPKEDRSKEFNFKDVQEEIITGFSNTPVNTYKITRLGMLHSVLSLSLILLFFYVLRNHFRMR